MNSTSQCVICKDDRTYFAVGICDHDSICLYCSLRMRILYKDTKCPICTAKLEYVFMFEIEEKMNFDKFNRDKEKLIKDDDFKNNGIYYSSYTLKEEVLKLRNFICPVTNCAEGSFDTMQNLSTHLNKIHKRSYCDVCLQENKKFLSEMKIYNFERLKEHFEFGEYTETGELLTPSHPECQFCRSKFYNDEYLFKHMNELHFNCQICKDRKNLIFYNDYFTLNEHYQISHFTCPYESCAQDIFVVFQNETELNYHLSSKHKISSATHNLVSLNYEGGLNKKKKIDAVKVLDKEFHFSNYVKQIKEKMENYVKNKQYIQAQTYEKAEEKKEFKQVDQKDNGSGKFYGKFDNNYQKEKGSRYDKKNQYYDFYGKYQNDQNSAYQDQKYYENENKGGKYKKNNQNYYYEDNNYYDGYNNKNSKKQNYQRDGDEYYKEETYQKENKFEKNNKKGKKNRGEFVADEKAFNEIENKPKVEEKVIPPKELKESNYSALLINLFALVKEFIEIKLKSNKYPITDYYLPRETTFQLIIVIDKMESLKKLAELKSVSDFGFPLDKCKDLREMVLGGYIEKKFVSELLEGIQIKKILILYKYLDISTKKLNGNFYKLDIEQIQENIGCDFGYVDHTNTKNKKNDKNYNKNQEFKVNSQKVFNDENFPNLIANKDDLKINTKAHIVKIEEEFKEQHNPLKNILVQDKNPYSNSNKPKQQNFTQQLTFEQYHPPTNKLGDLLSQPKNIVKNSKPQPKKKHTPTGIKNITTNYDQAFPSL